MINIISKSYLSRNVSGPKKVVDNLIKGLNILGYPYVVNKRLDACQRLWIHDDTVALAEINKLSLNIKVIAGPNLYIAPRHVSAEIDLSKAIYLHPSEWSKDFWLDFGFNRCQIEVWPAGIDTDEFKPSLEERKYVLVYFKQRSKDELKTVEDALRQKNLIYKVIYYNYYSEEEYKILLSKAKYIIWLGRQESQGVALQEAMSFNVPILVCDVLSVGHWTASSKLMSILNEEENAYNNTTSAPYFNEMCGIKIRDLSKISETISIMESNWENFQPRRYILENLNLEKQARDFLAIYEKNFGLSFESGIKEKLINASDWRNNKLYFKLYLYSKNFIKKLIKR